MSISFRNTDFKLLTPPNKKFSVAAFLLIAIAGVSYHFFINPPPDFPLNTVYSIGENRALSEIANDAKARSVVRSALALKILIILRSGDKGAISGDYVLNKKENVFKISKRFANGDYRLSAVKITLPEGLNVYEITELLSKKSELKNFDTEEFLRLAKGKEGYMYPDTYYFLPNVKAKQIIETMEENFTKKTALIQRDAEKMNKNFKDFLIMASILEEEVRTTEDRKIVAGILWKRIKIGMPLQVDAVFPYITQRKNRTIIRDDLKINSLYNTYLNKGLPPGPISNPSVDAILAAMNPTESKYLYYISDKKGITYFAKTLEEHNKNIEKYLR